MNSTLKHLRLLSLSGIFILSILFAANGVLVSHDHGFLGWECVLYGTDHAEKEIHIHRSGWISFVIYSHRIADLPMEAQSGAGEGTFCRTAGNAVVYAADDIGGVFATAALFSSYYYMFRNYYQKTL